MNSLSLFLSGAVTTAFAICGLFFFKFWRKTRDRLFAIFGLAFWTMALEHVLVFVVLGTYTSDARHPLVYLLRLAAFVMILAGIVDKNRQQRRA